MDEQFDPRPQYRPTAPSPHIHTPSPTQQSWGAIISIIIILAMVVMGAFYAWGKRIAEKRSVSEEATSTSFTITQ